MRPRPPSSTLFPYTTLFRSRLEPATGRRAAVLPRLHGRWLHRLPRHHEDGRRERLQRRRSEEHTSELQSRGHLVCRLLLEKKKKKSRIRHRYRATRKSRRVV